MAANKGPAVTASARASNALATASVAANANVVHEITEIFAGYSDQSYKIGRGLGKLEIFDGATSLHVLDVFGDVNLTGLHICGTAGNAVSAALDAEGNAGVYGVVAITVESA